MAFGRLSSSMIIPIGEETDNGEIPAVYVTPWGDMKEETLPCHTVFSYDALLEAGSHPESECRKRRGREGEKEGGSRGVDGREK